MSLPSLRDAPARDGLTIDVGDMALSSSGVSRRASANRCFSSGYDKPEYREQGTADLLDALGRALEGQAANA